MTKSNKETEKFKSPDIREILINNAKIIQGDPPQKKQNPYYFYKNKWVLFFWVTLYIKTIMKTAYYKWNSI